MRRYTVSLVLTVLFTAGCAGAGGSRSVPAVSGTPAGTPSGFTVPAKLTRAVPPPPPAMTPVKPSTARRSTSTAAPHPPFFAGEAALGNGVYYLALPNGNPFGYYSYLPDSSYIYHFDMGYEYLADANDGQGGIYLYDFASGHWWYTGRNYPFPYVYDFTRKSLLYYYPDTKNAGHYTTSPRYFYDFGTNQIITMPAPAPAGTAQNVYVVDFDPNTSGNPPSSIFEFAGSAHGTATPSRTIGSSNGGKNDILVTPAGEFFGCGQLSPANSTRVVGCGAVARDKSNGHLYHALSDAITEYSADKSQTVRRIPLNQPFIQTQAMAVDSQGNLFVGDSDKHEIDVYPPGATTPSRHLGNVQGSPISTPYALVFDSQDNLYDLDDSSLFVFAPGSNGASASGPSPACGGSAAGYPVAMAIDEKDDLYLAFNGVQNGKGPSLMVCPPASAQNVQYSTLDLSGIVKYPISIAIGP